MSALVSNYIVNNDNYSSKVLNTTFTPSPSINNIYIMNCSGGASANTTDLNSTNLKNLLSTLNVNANIDTNPYYFSFFASDGRTYIHK